MLHMVKLHKLLRLLATFSFPSFVFFGHLAFCCLNKVDVFGTGELLPGTLEPPLLSKIMHFKTMSGLKC